MCSNNPQYEHECIKYINNLTIPEWYEIEIKVIRDAASITSGYNRGMLSSDAKYKIYLHQDTFIINKDFLNCLLKGFNDEATGMLALSAHHNLIHPASCGLETALASLFLTAYITQLRLLSVK